MNLARMSIIAVGALAAASCGEAGGEGTPAEDVEVQTSDLIVANTQVGSGDPGSAVFKGNTYLTYTGTDGRINIIKNNTTKQILNQTARGGAAIVAVAQYLVLLWVPPDGSFHVLSCQDGVNWGNHMIVNQGAHLERAPAAVYPSNVAGDLWVMLNMSNREAVLYKSWNPSVSGSWSWVDFPPGMSSNDAFSAAQVGTTSRYAFAWSSTANWQANIRTLDVSRPYDRANWSEINLVPAPVGNPSVTNWSNGIVLGQRILGSGITLRRSTNGLTFGNVWTLTGQTTNAKPITYNASSVMSYVTWVGTNATHSLCTDQFWVQ